MTRTQVVTLLTNLLCPGLFKVAGLLLLLRGRESLEGFDGDLLVMAISMIAVPVKIQ